MTHDRGHGRQKRALTGEGPREGQKGPGEDGSGAVGSNGRDGELEKNGHLTGEKGGKVT